MIQHQMAVQILPAPFYEPANHTSVSHYQARKRSCHRRNLQPLHPLAPTLKLRIIQPHSTRTANPLLESEPPLAIPLSHLQYPIRTFSTTHLLMNHSRPLPFPLSGNLASEPSLAKLFLHPLRKSRPQHPHHSSITLFTTAPQEVA
jgi:hypothetical protein